VQQVATWSPFTHFLSSSCQPGKKDLLSPFLTPTEVCWDCQRIAYRDLKDVQTEEKEQGQFIPFSAADGEHALAQEVLCSL